MIVDAKIIKELDLITDDAEKLGDFELSRDIDYLVAELRKKRVEVDLLKSPAQIMSSLKQLPTKAVRVKLVGSTLSFNWSE